VASELTETLTDLTTDLRWSWMGGEALFASIDAERWRRCAGNPVRMLQETPPERLAQLAGDPAFRHRLDAVREAVAEDRSRPTADVPGPIAFFCAEYAVHRCLPIYSGGLGVLAGDILKQASDQALPMVAVGLMYREGYFHQRIDATGWQQESWEQADLERLPLELVRGADGEPLTASVPIGLEDVVVQVWRARVGGVQLLLLDSDRPENDGVARWITARLYVGDERLRLAQYLVLGIGGVRVLDALGIEPAVVHLNEGHAAFAALELAAQARRSGASPQDALAAARARTVFTTHTPVPAGNDTYAPEQVERAVGRLADESGLGVAGLIALGRTHPEDEGERFGVTQFALRTSRRANGVSARHGEVARDMWQALDVPIGSVTNGVHLPTWLGDPMRALLDRHLGADWLRRAVDPQTWAPLRDAPAAELWAARQAQRAQLVERARARSVRDRLARGDTLEYARSGQELDPHALTIGFARRVATYKRIGLLLAELEANLGLLNSDRPIQVLLAGKAHPRDDDAKRSLQALFSVRGAPGVGSRVVFLEDYDVESAALLVAGCDVWVNLPRPPLEASGTSGMKSAINGGLQLSVLDGWWVEGYDGTNGWALPGDVWEDTGAQDARDGAELHRVLAEQVIPLFHDRGDDGIPHGWLEMVRNAIVTVGPRFGAGRMIDDYLRDIYPA
jgi:starch phosphorylase